MAAATILAIFSLLLGDGFTGVKLLCFTAYVCTFICMKFLHNKNILCTKLYLIINLSVRIQGDYFLYNLFLKFGLVYIDFR